MTNNTGGKKMDVSKPGKTPADASARPVIITHRPMVQDPMMKQETDVSDMGMDESATVKDKLTNSGEKVIKPINEDVVADAPADDEQAEEKTETEVSESEKATDNGSEKDKADEAKNSASKKDATEAAVVDAVVDQAAKDKRNENELSDQELAKQERIQKLIEEKKYFVKTGQVARRRNNRIAIIFLVLIVLLVGAYLAVDAKLVKTSFDVPIQFIQN